MLFDPLGAAFLLIPILFLLRGHIVGVASATIIYTILGATAFVTLTALGGASITVPYIGLGLLIMGFAPRWWLMERDEIYAVLYAALPLIVFTLYTLVISYFGPRIFADAMYVVSMRPLTIRYVILEEPLGPSTSNITTPVYVLGGTLATITMAALASRPGVAPKLQTALLWVAAMHAMFGLIDMLAAAAGQDKFLDFFRTANYSQLTQEMFGFKRISGTFSETSGYAGFGQPLFVFATECWWRNRGRYSGRIAIALLAMLFLSTSTTAYASLAVYLAFFGVRALFTVGQDRLARQIWILAGILLFCVTMLLGLLLLSPDLIDNISTMLVHVTAGKADSSSAAERGAWARQGIAAFKVSWGVGVGAGSFRSSGLIQSLLGSVGLIGTAAYAFHISKIFRAASQTPQNEADFDPRPAAYAALFGLFPQIFAAPSVDTGAQIALFTGLSLAGLAVRELYPVVEAGPPRPA